MGRETSGEGLSFLFHSVFSLPPSPPALSFFSFTVLCTLQPPVQATPFISVLCPAMPRAQLTGTFHFSSRGNSRSFLVALSSVHLRATGRRQSYNCRGVLDKQEVSICPCGSPWPHPNFPSPGYSTSSRGHPFPLLEHVIRTAGPVTRAAWTCTSRWSLV